MHFELAYFYIFVLIHLELKRQIRLYACVVPSKIIPVFRPKRNKKAKTLTFAAVYTYMAYMAVYTYMAYISSRKMKLCQIHTCVVSVN